MRFIILGHINSGKSTISNYICQKYDFKHYALGDGVKKVLVEIADLFDIKISIHDLYNRKIKEKYREQMQKISTDILKKNFGDNIWIDYLKRRLPEDKYVIDDIRFKNEYEAFHDDKTISIRIIRPGQEIQSNHISEHDLDDTVADFTIVNDSDLDDLFKQVDLIMQNNCRL